MTNNNDKLSRTNTPIAPILKWAGGKRQLLSEIQNNIPTKFSTYYEPFLGGGAVLFHLKHSKAIVNDLNEELINVYKTIKNDIDELISDLKKHKNHKDYYYEIRAIDRDKERYNKMTNTEKASRIIYLNKTCYNGLFRVNKKREFNTPFGKYKNPNIVNETTLRTVSSYLNTANINFKCCDFEDAIKDIKKEDFVYFDPPYDPVSNSANFTGYEKSGFNKEQQIRLKKLCDSLNNKNIKFLLSNSATDFILDLYKDYKIQIVNANRAINSKASKRGEVNEVLVRNY